VLSFLGSEILRTIAYVDGYNLFFGCLKGSPYKWLDLVALIETILHVQDPSSTLVQVKYFTAPIKAKLASRKEQAAQAQQTYHRALNARGRVTIYEGWYSLEPVFAPKYKVPPDKQDRVAIWRLEEKETDVSIALQLYRDAVQGACDQVVLISNDSDLVPALSLVREDRPEVRRGIIIPRAEARAGADKRRPINAALSSLANWTRHEIKDAELAACQLPQRVGTQKKPADKPGYW
jgi:hypothetical protein